MRIEQLKNGKKYQILKYIFKLVLQGRFYPDVELYGWKNGAKTFI